MTWSKYDTGVLCLVKDLKNESYYFRLYNLNVIILLYKPLKIVN